MSARASGGRNILGTLSNEDRDDPQAELPARPFVGMTSTTRRFKNEASKSAGEVIQARGFHFE